MLLHRLRVFVLILVLFFSVTGVSCQAAEVEMNTQLYQLDFTAAGENGRDWLLNQGFQLAKEMDKKGEIEIKGSGPEKGLILSTEKHAFGFTALEGLNLADVGRVEIEWGVLDYPEGAAWSKNLNREPLMVQVFFGDKVAADKIYLPKSPFYIGLFLGQEKLNTPFTGKSYTKTARYVCLGNPAEGETLTSSIDIDTAFQSMFSRKDVPPVTGIGLEVDTSDLPDGRSKAFIKKLTLFRR